MALFRRRRQPEPVEVEEVEEVVETLSDREHGPWDASEVEERGSRVDLGALWIPNVPGMKLRLEVDKKTGQPTSAIIRYKGSSLQVQAFAAPRNRGIWDEIRAELQSSVSTQGGTADDLPGPFGRELITRLPAKTKDGRDGFRPARFLGVDGPRWFLRGAVSGPAAVDPKVAGDLEEIFADIVVIRDELARIPRELLPLRMPGTAAPPPVEPPPSLDPLLRGPEIAEIR